MPKQDQIDDGCRALQPPIRSMEDTQFDEENSKIKKEGLKGSTPKNKQKKQKKRKKGRSPKRLKRKVPPVADNSHLEDDRANYSLRKENKTCNNSKHKLMQQGDLDVDHSEDKFRHGSTEAKGRKETTRNNKKSTNWRSSNQRRDEYDGYGDEEGDSYEDISTTSLPGAVAVHPARHRVGMREEEYTAIDRGDEENPPPPPDSTLVEAELVEDAELAPDIKHVVAVPATNLVQKYWKVISVCLLVLSVICVFALTLTVASSAGGGSDDDEIVIDPGNESTDNENATTTVNNTVVGTETLNPAAQDHYDGLLNVLGSYFDGPNFPSSTEQTVSLVWLSNNIDQIGMSVDHNNADLLLDRYLLAHFLSVTSEIHWENNQELLGTVDVCDWHGLGCSSNNRVNSIVLPNYALDGGIPTELGLLTILTHLDLSSNYLSGRIPSEIGGLVNLVYLRLADNFLTGSVPTELESLVDLGYLNVEQNNLSGPFACQTRQSAGASSIGGGGGGGPPMIYNGDFEAGIGKAPGCWEHSSWDPLYRQVEMGWSPTAGYDGTGGVRIANIEENDSRFFQVVRGLEVGEYYKVSGKIKVNRYESTSQEWDCGGSISRIAGFDRSICVNEVSDWIELDFVFVADSATDEIGCRLGHYGAIAVGEIYCDDFRIEKL